MALKLVSHIKDLTVHAVDGDIGEIEEFYFDDETWTIRYLIVSTGNWLTGRSVLISPIFMISANWNTKQFHLSLTKEQIERSPNIDTHKPVSRQQEAELQSSFGRPYYWGGSSVWGVGAYPADLAVATLPAATAPVPIHESTDSHLRSTKAVDGYDVMATDGEIGHIRDFIVDELDWTIRYVVVSTRNWLPGKSVLLAPEWVQKVSWPESQVYVALDRETIKSAPEFIESRPITRDYESLLHGHYGQPEYWTPEGNTTRQLHLYETTTR